MTIVHMFSVIGILYAAVATAGEPLSAGGEHLGAPGFVVGVVEEGSLAYRDVEEKLQEVLPKSAVLVRYRLVRIDANWLVRSNVPDEIEIEFFDDFSCHAVNIGIQDGWNNRFTWKGICDAFGEQVVRIIKSPMGRIYVTLDLPRTSYGIKWLRDSTHVIWETDPSKYHLLRSSE